MKTTIDGTELRIVRGNLAEDTSDAIALPVGLDFRPAGPSAGAVFGAAGQGIEEEIASINDRDSEAVRIVDACDLPSEYILLSALKPSGEIENRPVYLKERYTDVLSLSSNHSKINSVSIMPLGLGDHGYSIDTVARSGIESVVEFHGKESLSVVKVVIYDAIEYSSFIRFGNEMINE